MLIRFFNDWGLRGEPVVLIGVATPTADRGEAREAVRLAMPEDRELYPEAWAAYEATQPAPEEPEAGSEEFDWGALQRLRRTSGY